jgi:hypothetical protein
MLIYVMERKREYKQSANRTTVAPPIKTVPLKAIMVQSIERSRVEAYLQASTVLDADFVLV